MSLVVLVIDDDPDFRTSVADVLREAGHQALLAANGREALDLLDAGARPDLILVDVFMPVMDGWHFLSARLAYPDVVEVPIVFMSASQQARLDVRKSGAWGFASKPFGVEEVLASVGSGVIPTA